MTIENIIYKLSEILDTLFPFLISLGVIVFVWGVIQYVIAGDEEAKTKGRDRMLWGIIGFTVIVALSGLVSIMVHTFGLDQTISIDLIPKTLSIEEGEGGSCMERPVGNLADLLCRVGYVLNKIIPLLISFGLIIFVWGVVQYVIAGGDEEAKTKGRDRMIYGIIGLAVIASIWGLVNVVVSTFGLENSNSVASEFLQNTETLGGTGGVCGIPPSGANFGHVMNYLTCLITKSFIPLVFSLAVLLFVWGVVQYVVSGASEEQKEKGKQYMLWGIIALTVMVSVWGIAKIIGTTFGIEYAIPQVKGR